MQKVGEKLKGENMQLKIVDVISLRIGKNGSVQENLIGQNISVSK